MMTKNALFKQLPVPWEPRNYSKKAAKFLLEHSAGALFLDPGLGKTSITYAAIKVLLKKKMIVIMYKLSDSSRRSFTELP